MVLGDSKAVEALVRFVEESGEDITRKSPCWEAVKALGRIGGVEAEEALMRLRKSNNMDLQREASATYERLFKK